MGNICNLKIGDGGGYVGGCGSQGREWKKQTRPRFDSLPSLMRGKGEEMEGSC